MKFEKPWFLVESEQVVKSLGEELIKEVVEGHLLYGKKAVAIARRFDNDEVIYKLCDNSFALVHLTWRRKKEINKNYPLTNIFKTLEELKECEDF